MFSPISIAEWTLFGTNASGTHTFYLDFERIRKNEGYIHFWVLSDLSEPTPSGTLSGKEYFRGDCENFRLLRLALHVYPEPMGEGGGDVINQKDQDWEYPTPNSVNEKLLETFCSQ